GEAVVEARPAEPVTVGDLDDRDPGRVQRADDVAHLLRHELVTLVVRAVAQAGVGEAQVQVRGLRGALVVRGDVGPSTGEDVRLWSGDITHRAPPARLCL